MRLLLVRGCSILQEVGDEVVEFFGIFEVRHVAAFFEDVKGRTGDLRFRAVGMPEGEDPVVGPPDDECRSLDAAEICKDGVQDLGTNTPDGQEGMQDLQKGPAVFPGEKKPVPMIDEIILDNRRVVD